MLKKLFEYIKVPKWDRIFRIKDALMIGVSVKRICESTGIDQMVYLPDSKNL
ncbi:MAG: hypothetical protein WKF59_09560 [Chitinophagaceae bacterium]